MATATTKARPTTSTMATSIVIAGSTPYRGYRHSFDHGHDYRVDWSTATDTAMPTASPRGIDMGHGQ